MTKKFMHTTSSFGDLDTHGEFIIPDIFSDTPNLIGIETGRQYSSGQIVYTGVDLIAREILYKIERQRSLGFFRRRKAKKIIEKYLHQINDTKIGSIMTLTNEHELKNIDNKIINIPQSA